MFQFVLSLFKREKTIFKRCDEAREAGLQAFEKGLEQTSNPICAVDAMIDVEWKSWDSGWQTGQFLQDMAKHRKETKKLQEAVKNWRPKQSVSQDRSKENT